jgi:hypothetical protein
MAVSASPTARAVRTACFAEQMEQKKQLLLASSKTNYPPAFHSLRAGSRTIYQNGTDVNVLFERRVAAVNTQSQHRSRKKWWIDKKLLALEQAGGRTGALPSKNIDQTVKRLYAFFSDCVRSLGCCNVQRQVLFPVSSLHEVVPITTGSIFEILTS